VRSPEQLIRDLGLVDGRAADDEPAVSNDVAFDAPADREQRDPCLRCGGELGRDALLDVLDRRFAVAPFGDQLTVVVSVRLKPTAAGSNAPSPGGMSSADARAWRQPS
jgi:hypothetical protein